MKRRRRPRLAVALLACLPPDRDALIGDLLEELDCGRSRTWFWQQVLYAVVAELFREKHAGTLIGEPPRHTTYRHRRLAPRINLSGTATGWVGGSGLAFLGLMVTLVVPQFWLLFPAAVAGGAILAVVLVLLRRRTLCVALVVTASAALAAQESVRPAVPVDPIVGILDAFELHPVVALPGGFGAARRALLDSLLRDSRFPRMVNDIVVEFGSSRFQDAMDRYIRGEDVPHADLRRAWQDTTSPTGNDSEPVEEFFRTVRDLNASLPAERKIRVLLGEPPIDWDQVRTKADHRKWIVVRDLSAGDLIRREVIVRGRRALVLYGQLHYLRKEILTNYDMSNWQAQTLVSWLEASGVNVFTIWAASTAVVAAQPDAASWPQMRLALIRGTPLGAADFTAFEPGAGRQRYAIRGIDDFAPIPREQFRSLRMEEQVDAILYTGGGTPDPPIARVSPSTCTQPGYLDMRLARIALAGLPRAEGAAIRAACGPQSQDSPLTGTWVADLAKSRLHKGSPVRSTTLRFTVTGESVSITDTTRDASGKEIGTGTTVFVTDGKSHPHDALVPGLTVVAIWRHTRLFETVLTRNDGQVDRVTYEVSDDGKTLTTRTSGPLGDQEIFFYRQ